MMAGAVLICNQAPSRPPAVPSGPQKCEPHKASRQRALVKIINLPLIYGFSTEQFIPFHSTHLELFYVSPVMCSLSL